MNEKVVIEHVLDEDACVYRLVVGEPVYESVTPTVEEGNGGGLPGAEEIILIKYVNILDFVFDCDDPRWLDSNGNRRFDDEVAAAQRDAVRDAIAANATAGVVPGSGSTSTPVVLPGVGETL